MNKTMTAKEILVKYKLLPVNQYIEDVMNAMKEYGKQCYIQGSNDCHKAMIDSLPDDEVIQKEADIAYPCDSVNNTYLKTVLENSNQGFVNGAMWIIKTIKGE